MNIEELSKSQLILLTILVNFVTSVATGILTVSLLDHAPAVVTQTVNRVVEHTIETVTQAAPVASIITPTPAPSNQDLVTAAIGAAASRMVAIYPADASTSTPAIAVGTYLPKSRVVVTAAQDALPKEALLKFTDGSLVGASLSKADNGVAIYGFADAAVLPKIAASRLIPAGELKLGETALAIGADGSAATGIVSRVGEAGIRTTLPSIGTGSAVVDLEGNVIGISAGASSGLLIETDVITALLLATSTSSKASAK